MTEETQNESQKIPPWAMALMQNVQSMRDDFVRLCKIIEGDGNEGHINVRLKTVERDMSRGGEVIEGHERRVQALESAREEMRLTQSQFAWKLGLICTVIAAVFSLGGGIIASVVSSQITAKQPARTSPHVINTPQRDPP